MALRLRTDCPNNRDMSQISSFRDVIELWPSREAMAADIRAGASAVSKWWQRDNIPSEWWAAILAAPLASGISADDLIRLAAREAAEARA